MATFKFNAVTDDILQVYFLSGERTVMRCWAPKYDTDSVLCVLEDHAVLQEKCFGVNLSFINITSKTSTLCVYKRWTQNKLLQFNKNLFQ